MNKASTFKTFLDVSINRHPGRWFEYAYESLSEPEKIAWLELFTLACASFPSAHVNYVSERQVSALFGIKEEAFESVVNKAIDLGIIKVVEKAIKPAAFRTKEDSPYGPLTARKPSPGTDLDETKPWARYKSMFFPGHFEYREKTSAEGDRPPSDGLFCDWFCGKHPLDAKLEDPVWLLDYRIGQARRGELRSDHTGESPILRIPILEVPEAVLTYDDASVELNLELLGTLDNGLALWNGDHDALMRIIWSTWIELRDWLMLFVHRDGVTVFLE